MLKDVVKMKVVGDPYFGDVVLDIFEKEKNVLSCIYGKNGSGKTSFSKIVKDIATLNPNCASSFLKSDDSPTAIEESESVHVFNEKYIDENVRAVTDESTMAAILLFGKRGNIDDDIKKYEQTIEEERKQIKDRNIEEYDGSSSKKSIGKARDAIKDYLQKSWSIRQQSIKKSNGKSPVRDQIIDRVIDEKSGRKTKDVKAEYDPLLDSIKKLDENSETVQELSITFNNEDEAAVVELLNRSYDKKTISDLSMKIIEITNKKGLSDVLRKSLSDKDNICPICLQPLTDDHRDHLSNAINEAFDETIKEAIKKVDSTLSSLNAIEADLLSYSSFCDEKSLKGIEQLVKEYNDIVGKYRELLKTKKNNIYESSSTATLGLKDKENSIRTEIDKLNDVVRKHNDIIANYNDNVKKLEALNIELSALEASSLIKSYKDLIKEKDEAETLNKRSNEKIELAESEINKLRQELKSFSVAKDEINKDLAIIFASKKRLRLKEGEDPSKYYVYSKGKKVKLANLSTGERNIIALCYFFEQLKTNSTINDYFKKPMLVVVDDPISSFDYENKLSVFAYVSKMIGMILEANAHSKVIVMSHERSVIYSLNNQLKGFAKVTRRIINKSIVNFNPGKNSNYEDLIKEVYEFANCNPDEEPFESKGNEIRKLLEAYSTFNYKYGVEELLTDEQLLKRITDDDLRNYYKQSLNVLVLNFSSHTEQMAKQFPYIDSFDAFSPEEQVKHAKGVLSYLYLIDKLHIERYLPNGEGQVIEGWINDVKNILKSDD